MQSTDQSTSDKRRAESLGGILLIGAALLAMVFANSPLSYLYDLLLDLPVAFRIGEFELAKPLLLWINDGLMAIFFLLVGLELKREWIEGELADRRQVMLPALGAVGGMLVPAAFYLALNGRDAIASQGWAIPAATDIAFALGILALLGERIPSGVRIFLAALAIFDDIGAIVIIAVYYTESISTQALSVVIGCIACLALLNWRGVESRSVYILVGLVMWLAMLKSGVHATLAGVVLAMFVPMYSQKRVGYSLVKSLEHDLHFAVAFLILPVFAFANAGLSFSGVGIGEVLHPIPLGIALGLILGKPLGIYGICTLALHFGWAKMPAGMTRQLLLGTATLCGVGFTMSLFISALAFQTSGVELLVDERLGIVLGSSVAGLAGYLMLRWTSPLQADSVPRRS